MADDGIGGDVATDFCLDVGGASVCAAVGGDLGGGGVEHWAGGRGCGGTGDVGGSGSRGCGGRVE